MTIEQKPELNRFVDYSIPLTWAKRWRGFKTTLPIWVFIFLCITEMAVLGAWFADRLSWDVIAPVAGSLPVFFVMFWGMIELQVWFYARSKRILRVGDKRIVVSPAKQQYIRLKSVTKFQFEPIAENPALTKLSVFVYFSKRIPAVRRFSMIVADPAQVQELVQTLEVRRQATGADFKIIVLDKPDPPPAKTSLCFMSLSVFFAGFYLLLHGLPLLAIALLPRQHDASDNPNFKPEQVAKLGRFLADHFSSVAQLHHFYLTAGGVLTITGLALMFWRSRLPDSKPAA